MYVVEQDGILKIDAENQWLTLNSDSDMIYYTFNGKTYRRTKMNDFLELGYIKNKRYVRKLSITEAKEITGKFYAEINNLSENFPLLKSHVKNYNYLRERGNELIKIYGDKIPIVPPDRYFSLYIRISGGCPWNQCTFCNLYKDEKYSLVSMDDLKSQIISLKQYYKNSIKSINGIFLGDANSIGVNMNLLTDYIKYIKDEFNMPLYSFSDAFTTPLKKQNLGLLKDQGLRRIYIGVESGNERILQILNKKVNLNVERKFIKSIKEAGINTGLIVMSGFGKDHCIDTVNFLKSFEYSKGDIIYISPVKEYNDFPEILRKNSIETSDENSINEYNYIKNELKRYTDIPVVVYNVEESLY